ncbi:MAG: RluA family pseudouridine synthase [Pseudomonadota bacterium]
MDSVAVPPELADQRLDKVLSELLPDVSRASAAAAIGEGFVTVDGVTISKASHKVRAGQTLNITPVELESLSAAPEDLPLDVVFEDAHIAVLRKAPGMVVHPAKGHPSGTLVNALMHRWRGDPEEDGALRFGVVHRLDQGTSGLMVVARTPAAGEALQRQFQERTVRKIYLALVAGVPKDDTGTIDKPLARHPTDRKRFTGSRGGGRDARTDWAMVDRGRGVSLFAVRIHTGRTHQIRVHLSEAGFPIIGDDLYGGRWLNRVGNRGEKSYCQRARRPMLHSALLSFTHPATGEDLTFTAPPAADMADLAGRILPEDGLAVLADPTLALPLLEGIR